jgi:hypothetical protein
MNDTSAVILSVIIPLLAFMLALLPWIKHVIRSEISPLAERIAKIEGKLNTFIEQEHSRVARLEDSFKEQQKGFLDLYRDMAKIKNPDTDEGILLTKLKNETITNDEAIRLREIMNKRKQEAEQNNDFLKAILIIGILGLIAYVLSRDQ